MAWWFLITTGLPLTVTLEGRQDEDVLGAALVVGDVGPGANTATSPFLASLTIPLALLIAMSLLGSPSSCP